jgi:hypothetical protein
LIIRKLVTDRRRSPGLKCSQCGKEHHTGLVPSSDLAGGKFFTLLPAMTVFSSGIR